MNKLYAKPRKNRQGDVEWVILETGKENLGPIHVAPEAEGASEVMRFVRQHPDILHCESFA